MRSSVPRVLIVAGVVLIVGGLLAWTGMLSWFGHLPGDIRIERENARINIPLASMVVAFIVLSLVMALLRRQK